ncbi:MAG: aminotransferase class IV, partial [Candidatus Omnitrophota bacterium]
FLYHKTTNRKLYDAEYRRARSRGFYDVIFSNEKGEITEGAISNIVIKSKGVFYTPPVECGLLDGVYRRYLLRSGKYSIKEKALFKKDIVNAEEIYLTNSVRGMVRVCLGGK